MGAKSVVFILEKGGVDFVPTQQHTQRAHSHLGEGYASSVSVLSVDPPLLREFIPAFLSSACSI